MALKYHLFIIRFSVGDAAVNSSQYQTAFLDVSAQGRKVLVYCLSMSKCVILVKQTCFPITCLEGRTENNKNTMFFKTSVWSEENIKRPRKTFGEKVLKRKALKLNCKKVQQIYFIGQDTIFLCGLLGLSRKSNQSNPTQPLFLNFTFHIPLEGISCGITAEKDECVVSRGAIGIVFPISEAAVCFLQGQGGITHSSGRGGVFLDLRSREHFRSCSQISSAHYMNKNECCFHPPLICWYTCNCSANEWRVTKTTQTHIKCTHIQINRN